MRERRVSCRSSVGAIFAVALGGLSGLTAAPFTATAQTASEVTPGSFQPPLRRLGGAVVFSGQAGTQAPAGADAIGITLSGIRLENALPQMAAANAAFEARLTRGRIPVSELFDATADLEAAYAEAGYVLARAVLPEQALRDGGVLRVTIVNGFVERVDTAALPPEVRPRIEALTLPLVDRAGITLRELERQLLLAGDTSGLALGSALAPGQRQGGTVIALDPEFQSVTGFIGFDNFAPGELGALTINAGVEFNSLLGQGETFYARLGAAPNGLFSADPRYRVLALGVVLPIGPSGLTLNAEVTSSDTTPDDDDTPTRSDFDRQSLRLSYPFVRSRQVNLSGQLVLDRLSDRQALIAGATETRVFSDKLTVLRAGATLGYVHEDGARTDAGLTVSRGIDAFGARTAADADGATPLSRDGADATFTKVTGSVAHRRSLGDRLALSLTGRFQSSLGEPLLTSEQFSIAGSSELSTFDGGALRGDSGWVARAELSSPQEISLGGRSAVLSPYVFASAGAVTIEEPTAVEVGREAGRAFGVGVDLLMDGNTRFQSSALRVEFGKGDRDHGPDDTRFSLSGNIRF